MKLIVFYNNDKSLNKHITLFYNQFFAENRVKEEVFVIRTNLRYTIVFNFLIVFFFTY